MPRQPTRVDYVPSPADSHRRGGAAREGGGGGILASMGYIAGVEKSCCFTAWGGGGGELRTDFCCLNYLGGPVAAGLFWGGNGGGGELCRHWPPSCRRKRCGLFFQHGQIPFLCVGWRKNRANGLVLSFLRLCSNWRTAVAFTMYVL